MRDKIENIVSNVLRNYDWKVSFGYDCIRITLFMNEIFSDIPILLINELGNELDSDISWLTCTDGNIELNYDITNLINKEYKNDWSAYENRYFK